MGKTKCAMQSSLCLQTSRIFQTPCPLLKLRRSWVCTTCVIVNGSFSQLALRQETASMKGLIGCHVRFQARNETTMCLNARILCKSFAGTHSVQIVAVVISQPFSSV